MPSSRFRAYQYREPLAALGVEADYLQIEASHNWFKQARFLSQLTTIRSDYDAVVYLKQLEPARMRLLRTRCSRVLFDFDDAIHLRDGQARFARTLAAASGVIAGNPELSSAARRYHDRVTVVPTVVPVPPAPPPMPGVEAGIVLHWVGTYDNIARYLTPVLDGFARARHGLPELRLRIVTERPERVPLSPGVEAVRWSADTEWEEFARCHVGLMPLTDDAWSRGKCACKALQYLAAGRPVLSSPVGVNRAIFDGQPFGRLLDADEDWAEAIRGVVSGVAELGGRGLAGHAYVEEHYSLAAWTPKLWEALRG